MYFETDKVFPVFQIYSGLTLALLSVETLDCTSLSSTVFKNNTESISAAVASHVCEQLFEDYTPKLPC